MQRSAVFTFLLVLAATAGTGGGQEGPKKPRMDVRAYPRIALGPTNVLVTAELQGGHDVEDFYCPRLVWEWGDGDRSVQESDCPPFEPGVVMQRRFSARHSYYRRGHYTVTISLLRASRTMAVANTTVDLR
jgi:hypothetical protein